MSVRMTIPTQRVLEVLLAEAECYGVSIGQQARLASGTVHPILARLEGVGWVTSEWEDVDPSEAGRPARRYYRLTALGRAESSAALDRARARWSAAPQRASGASA